MRKSLKKKVLDANLALKEYGLVIFTWGNASQIDSDREFVVIKPSGVRYEELTADMMCVVRLSDGEVVDGDLKPSSDLETHLELYRGFSGIGGVVHTHSTYAVGFAQAGWSIPCYGTTHADYFYGEIPCTRALTADEIADNYEKNTGRVIVETFNMSQRAPDATPAVLVGRHGPFTWGSSAIDAVHNAAYLEEVARMAHIASQLSGNSLPPAARELMDKHYYRKHGENAYYGQ